MPICSRIFDQERILCWESGRAHSTRPLVASGRSLVAAVVVVASRSDYSCSRLDLCDIPVPSTDYSYWGLVEGYKSAMLAIDGTVVVAAAVELAPNLTFRGSSGQKGSTWENCKHLFGLFVLYYGGEFTPIAENRFFLPPSLFSGTTDVDALCSVLILALLEVLPSTLVLFDGGGGGIVGVYCLGGLFGSGITGGFSKIFPRFESRSPPPLRPVRVRNTLFLLLLFPSVGAVA